MSDIKFTAIISATNTQEGFPATNLLSHDAYKKWKCAAGMKQAVVILKIDQERCIESVDIGNEGSSFIEVLVGRSADGDIDAYHVLIMTSGYMSPADSKAWTNLNAVKLFSKDHLNKVTCNQKWDLVKIVCTQPYNTTQPYGLSFVRMKTISDVTNTADSANIHASTGIDSLGSVKFKPGSPSLLSPGSLFRKKSFENDDSNVMSITAKAKQACTNPSENEPNAKKLKLSPTQEASKIFSPIGETKKLINESAKSTDKYINNNSKPSKTNNIEEKSDKISVCSIFEGVVFALSGYKNPKRGDLRDKAVEMGAKYESDWNQKCTHLICAFKNTPKFKQVAAKNTSCIVGDKWIDECYNRKKRISAERWLMSSIPEPTQSFGNVSKITPPKFDSKSKGKNENNKCKIAEISPNKVDENVSNVKSVKDEMISKSEIEEKNDYDASTDEEIGMDTSEIIPTNNPNSSDDKDDITDPSEILENDSADYDASTEEEPETIDLKTDSSSTLPIKIDKLNLPNFFNNFIVLLYGDFAKVEDEKLIKRYLIAYGGRVSDYMSDEVTHVITSSPWDENFDEALEKNAKLQFVKPHWIFACHDKQKLVPYQHYNITP